MARALVIAALLITTATACGVEKTRYYHQAEGHVRLSGAAERQSDLSAGDAAYGAGNINGSDDSLYLDLSFSGGSFIASAEEVIGPGAYPLQTLRVEVSTTDSPPLAFQCSLSCEPCTVELTTVTDDEVAGAFACTGLRHCLEPTPLAQEGRGDPACNGAQSYIADVAADFKLSEGSDRRKDY